MIIAHQLQKTPELKGQRIGLALSGGGFRASIFHLGVIRRLEELGIMQNVDVISAVSGGSIIAAYYVCEMERRLRIVPREDRQKIDIRVNIFEDIAESFLSALDNNLRTRALVFTPFYYPWGFIKTLFLKPFRSTARSELIQREYDRWFYNGNTLDQLPSTASGAKASDVLGPKVLLNTTSLLSGERVTYSRVPVSGVNEMSKVNKNVLPLSRVVGASSGVPGLFPPTEIAGDILVDGGVADNQGIESLVDDPSRCNILIVSDASGQMEQLDSIGRGILTVVGRVNSVLQFQIRNKLIDILVGWKTLPDGANEQNRFAFIHLFLNLKDRPDVSNRVSSEFIAPIGRIRTDLDQFSYVEREALMYHGYTLIDAQLNKYCGDWLAGVLKADSIKTMQTPPLFREKVMNNEESRKIILDDLRAGSQNVYLHRCVKKYPSTVVPILGAWLPIGIGIFFLIQTVSPHLYDVLVGSMYRVVECYMPQVAVIAINLLLKQMGCTDLPTLLAGVSSIIAIVIILLLSLYIGSFLMFVPIRRITVAKDKSLYKKLTEEMPSARWSVKK
jgi:predicted acylesterase/phospholipase RssA